MAKSKKKKGNPGNGLGPHHEVSCMGHATRTKSRREKHRRHDRWDRKAKHKRGPRYEAGE